MADAASISVTGPLSLGLSVPVGHKYRMVAAALVGKLAEVSGFSAHDVQSLGQAFDRAAADVIALQGAGDADAIDIRCRRDDGHLEIVVTCGTHRAQVVRALPQ
jgi:hypothetical protein